MCVHVSTLLSQVSQVFFKYVFVLVVSIITIEKRSIEKGKEVDWYTMPRKSVVILANYGREAQCGY